MQIQINKLSGFTLLELIITVAIAGIMLAIAIPSFQGQINSSRLATQTNDLMAALNYARSEAITRGSDITIARVGGASKDWSGGWTIKEDTTLLKQHKTLKGGVTLKTGGTFANAITYDSNGFSRGSSNLTNGSFVFCNAAQDLASARKIAINNIGRAHVQKEGVTSCAP